jgi:hypothetical protein
MSCRTAASRRERPGGRRGPSPGGERPRRPRPGAATPEGLHEPGVRLGGHEAVPDPAGQLGGLRAAGRDQDRRRRLGKRVEPGVVDLVVAAAEVLEAAFPEAPDDRHRLLEHLVPHVGRRPLRAGHVLVQVLARADAEPEPARHHRGDRRRGLGHDRGMDPEQRARDARGDGQALGGLGDPAQGGPDERALPLPVRPWVEVVGDHREAEAGLLRARRLAHELPWLELLAGELVPDRPGSRPAVGQRGLGSRSRSCRHGT